MRYPRLILTSTDIQKGESVIFDNAYTDITIDKIVACAGYPFYGLKWTESEGKYLWDGSLLTNTPMLEVVRRSPKMDKKFYIVDVFPRQQKERNSTAHLFCSSICPRSIHDRNRSCNVSGNRCKVSKVSADI
jgi:predicted acylesterase/phospholipase RssA